MKRIESLMVIDDDAIFLYVTQKILEGIKEIDSVIACENGLQALDYLKTAIPSSLPEVIFLDLTMPVMDGWDFLSEFLELKEQLPHNIPIYIVTSSIAPKDIQRIQNIPEVLDFIVKPLTKEIVVDILNRRS